MPKFSVLTSVHLWHNHKSKQLERCHNSLINQSFKDFEHIVVNDGSILPMPECLHDDKIDTTIIDQPHHERIVALSKALEKAKGEWIVFLDSDDEFIGHTFECINQMIDKNPKTKMFNYGSFHVRRNYSTSIRGSFKPKRKKKGHEVFGGGNIVNGTFVFHRSIYDKLGGFPPNKSIKDPSGKRDFLYMNNPWDFSIAAQLEFPEIKKLFTADHPDHHKGLPKELGNPWGNDFYIFYKYTRKFHSVPYDIPLLIVHHEGKKDGESHFIE